MAGTLREHRVGVQSGRLWAHQPGSYPDLGPGWHDRAGRLLAPAHVEGRPGQPQNRAVLSEAFLTVISFKACSLPFPTLCVSC